MNTLRIGALLASFYNLLTPLAAEACTFRQQFFENTAEGTLALVRDASSHAEARTIYSGWCPVALSTNEISRTNDVIYFALNNRDDEAGTPKFYVVKIFRRSRATMLRPLLSLRRSGPWTQRPCKVTNPPRVFVRTIFAEGIAQQFLDRVKQVRSGVVGQCDAFGVWLADAHGASSLSIASTANFLLDTPERVKRTGIEKWSINVSAFAYKTEGKASRSAQFPQLGITRDGAEEIIVQYISSGSKYHEFTLVQ